MTPEALAVIHAAAFPASRGWSAEEFTALLASSHCFMVSFQDAFALGRVIVDEVELITIATHPNHQGQGLGRRCLQGFQGEARRRGATSAFLEVAADNRLAIHLYESEDWHRTGLRKGYYARPSGPPVDAVLMHKSLT
ncbi:GNAT family N-acetyltransferase [Shimia sediminis]|uniref:GNAT family N-acetyltransferase n=1 Tax=Shimia sediminis TaxID=2497945 RepID=UPI000F8C330F|nr:GNAT family N-acetyltransferase [Shimia sediminis]